MNAFTLAFVLLIAADLAVRGWLALRQIRHVHQHRDTVPEVFADRFTLEAHQRAADYTIAKTGFGVLELLAGSVLLLLWTLGGGLDALDRLWRWLSPGDLTVGVGFLLSAVVLMSLLELPLAAYRSFVIEQRFGFNRSGPGLFLLDTLKGLLLTVLVGAPLAWVVLWLMQLGGSLWWVWVWAVWTGFGLLMGWAYPSFIAPLFNRFTPLPEGDLKQRIQDLLARCGFTSNGIFVMDGSRRSAHGNAYFTGLGNHKRIVFFDTLIESLEAQETEAVLAHELGHFRRRHFRKRVLSMAAISLVALALLGWLAQHPGFYTGLGAGQPSPQMALALFLLCAPLGGLALQPVAAYFMRRHEFEADDFAAEQTGAGALVRALVKLYRENASTLTPDPLYSAFYDSHPPAPMRVAHLSSKMVS